ncbi:MAG TPA: site-2 protease family protein [Ferruginibacter sp.]|nr:site-2 protease family protein [Ferruginibacter sp.]
MKKNIKLFTFKGLAVKMHWTFLFILVWVIAAHTVNVFSVEKITMSVIFIVLVFVSILINELAHYAAGRYFNIVMTEINLLPTGGISAYENFPKTTKEELLISFAGPLANLAIAGVLLPFVQTAQPIWTLANHFNIIYEGNFIYQLYWVNLALFAVNLVPAFPLVGGRILRALFGIKMNYFKATRIVTMLSKIIAILFFIIGIFYFKVVFIVLGVLIVSAIQTEEYILHLRSLVKGVNFGEVVVNEYPQLLANSTVKEVMGELMTNHSKYFLVMDNGVPIGIIHRMRIISEAAGKKYDLPVKNLMQKHLIYFNSLNDVRTGFKTLVSFPYRIYPVMEEGLFKGVVSMMCILEYLVLHHLSPKEQDRLQTLIKKV